MRYSKQERDIIETLTRKIDELERKVTHLENNHNPTVHRRAKPGGSDPILDVEGAIFIATDNDICWVSAGVGFFANGTAI